MDIQPQHLELVRRILSTHLPSTEVWVFGSRATGTAKPFSDLDLAVVSGIYTDHSLNQARQAFDDSNLPYKVDLVRFADLPLTLQGRIQSGYEVIQPHVQPNTP